LNKFSFLSYIFKPHQPDNKEFANGEYDAPYQYHKNGSLYVVRVKVNKDRISSQRDATFYALYW